MRVDSNAGYKGTAFGDPARSVSQDTANLNAKQLTLATDTSKTEKLNSAKAKSYPVEFKGTAFGDPAKFNSPVTYNKNLAKIATEVKGNKFDISL